MPHGSIHPSYARLRRALTTSGISLILSASLLATEWIQSCKSKGAAKYSCNKLANMQHAEQIIFDYIPPFFLYTLLFLCGIVWQSLNANIIIIAITAASIALFCMSYHHQGRWKIIIPWAIAAFSIGALRNTLNEHYFLREADQLCNKKIDLVGTIIAQEKTNKQWVTCLTVETEIPTQALIKLYCTQPLQSQVGDSVSLQNVYLKKSTSNTLALFFKKQGIIATGYIGKQQTIQCRPAEKTNMTGWLHKKRDYLLQRLEKILSPRTFMLVSSIFLGYKSIKTKMSDVLYEQFQWWGISHYLARSGLHLVMFVIILHFLCMFLPIPFIVKQVLVSGCIAIYMLLSWSSVSFIRSLIMIFCYLLCSMFKIQQHGLHTISLACCAILLYNPAFLFALDFQLSFGLTLALILLHHAHYIRKNDSQKTIQSTT